MNDLKPGDWVTVYGQVARENIAAPPDDVVVELFSHNEQFVAVVRRDRVERCAPPRGIAHRCRALYRTPAASDTLLQCRQHERHDGEHRAVDAAGAPWSWTDDATTARLDGTELLS